MCIETRKTVLLPPHHPLTPMANRLSLSPSRTVNFYFAADKTWFGCLAISYDTVVYLVLSTPQQSQHTTPTTVDWTMEEQAIQQIVSSLELVHDPRTSNRQRQEAQSVSYLEKTEIRKRWYLRKKRRVWSTIWT